jgi:hypothetical protein
MGLKLLTRNAMKMCRQKGKKSALSSPLGKPSKWRLFGGKGIGGYFMSRRAIHCIPVALLALVGALFLASCGSSGASMNPSGTMINVRVSDPATCSGPKGTISHVFVTITDVLIHASASAGPNDAGWVDLTPNLKQRPMQVDLLGQADNQCFLATLGSTTEIQPGTFQQIRIILADNSATFEGNRCGSTANCVMLSSSPSSPQPLLLSSESQTGIKIPSGQLAGGQFVVAAGQTKDLDIDFNACESIVAEGNGNFRLKPVVRAGEVQLTSVSINGKIVDGASGQPIAGGTTVVALEQKDGSGVDRVIMQTLADSTGAFVFCPVAAGMYDVVAAAVDGSQVAFGATVITGVQPGNSLGTVPLTAQAGTNKSAGSITGLVTTSTGTAAATADISVSALQAITVNNSSVLVTIPLATQSATSVSLATAASASCPQNTDCANYTLTVPAANPSVGTFSTSGNQAPAPPSSGPVDYTVDALAFVAGGGNTRDCTTPDMQTNRSSTNSPLVVAAAVGVTGQTLAFSGCQ